MEEERGSNGVSVALLLLLGIVATDGESVSWYPSQVHPDFAHRTQPESGASVVCSAYDLSSSVKSYQAFLLRI